MRAGTQAGAPQEGAGLAKQYRLVAGLPMVVHTVRALAGVSRLQRTLAVLAPNDAHGASVLAGQPVEVAHCGGATRADSVSNGLEHLLALGAQPDDWVLVHDAARCLIQPSLVERLIDACIADPVGGLLALPLPDTLKQADHGRVRETLPRADKWLAQTPQMFHLGLLRRALREAPARGVQVTDEASAVEAIGLAPRLVEGSAQNFKVTYPADFELAEAVLNGRLARG